MRGVFSVFVDEMDMKTISVTTARKRFGALLDTVQHEPVLIRRKGHGASVVISAEEYRRIHGLANPERAQLEPKTNDSWKDR
jgi:prevent-host-death family protein